MERQADNRRGSRPSGVNKVFLLNTVHGLKSHNKREEEEDCWRQHALDRKAQGRDGPSNTSYPPRRREPTEAVGESAAGASEADARRFWAEQKERAMKATTPPIDATPGVGGGSLPVAESGGDRLKSRKRERQDGGSGRSSSPDVDRKRKKSKKKKAKKRRKKKKDEKKKRELEDRHGSGDSSSSDEVDSDADEGKPGSDGESERRRIKSKRHAQKKRKKQRR